MAAARADMMNRLRRQALFLLGLTGLFPSLCRAAAYEFEGLGVKEVARGGASVADVDDWTAIYWNPAGLAAAASRGSREAGMDVSGGIVSSKDSNSLSTPFGPIFAKDRLSSSFILGSAGGMIPVRKVLGIGFGFYIPLLQGSDFQDSHNGSETVYKGATGILVSNVSAGVQVLPKLRAGAGFNLIHAVASQESTLVVPAGVLAPLYLPDSLSGDLKGRGSGIEGVFGLRYDPFPCFSAGAVYRSGARIPIKGTAHAASRTLSLNETSGFLLRFNHPPTTAFGVAWRPDGRFTLSLDFAQTYWHGFRNAISYDNPGLLLANKENTDDWHDSYRIRTGLLARLSETSDLLFGYTFDQSALDPGSLDFSSSVDVDSHRFYAGTVRRWSRIVETSFCAVYGTGKRTEGSVDYRSGGWQMRLGSRFLF